MSKRHVAFIKPDEPSFLKKLKKEAGYKEGPTVDTKREDYGEVSQEDFEDKEDELPTVVVLKRGDLTAEEAKIEEDRLQKEIEEAPADLDAPIVFKAPKKQETEDIPKKKSSKNDSKKIKNKTLLSFNDEEDDD
ncbi:unnamed protein product [Psylliodes chrysocephalus]|uniref:DUF4604 domain-containing protein n=1 Tax=Psylliodes chrysocephalus TaxID=3402493 RepID=A0A9P0CF70_9CUCU|nr:unnamed protein product [Psylliodes chrysocephala]